MIDIIIVSDGRNELQSITKKAIESLINSESIQMNIVVMEQQEIEYENCTTLHPKSEYNYNRYINEAIENCENEYICFCNNDLIFHPGWLSSHMKKFQANPEVSSLSPRCPTWKNEQPYKKHLNFITGIHKGYRVGIELTGWCVTMRRTGYDKIGGLDTTTNFWYSDSNYAMQLKRNGLIHALDADSFVTHFFGASHHISPDIIDYTKNQEVKFKKRWAAKKIFI